MKNKSSSKGVLYRCLLYCIAILLLVMIPLKSFSQSTGELTTDSLVKMGFENVRWTDTPEERVYVVENSAYKIQALGIRKAVDIIQSMGLPKDKSCKLIVTNYNIPQVSLTYQPLAGDTTVVSGEDWKVSYDIGDSWDKVKKEKKKNSSLFKVDIFKFRYNDKYTTYWSVGGNFYWPRYNTQFKLRAEQYLLKEKGVRFEMIRHFRYASIGFYAVKAEHANSNGGFKFIVALPPYKYKRHKYIPRVSTSLGTGITYNAGNEKYYYKMPYSNASDNIMQQNSFNPYFIKSELLNF